MVALLLVAVPMMALSLAGENAPPAPKPARYEVRRLATPLTIDGKWDKPQWRDVEPLTIKNHMGDKPEHFPRVQARVTYDDNAVYVIFRVEDQYVRAVAKQYDGEVWKDSCVEFFFTPGGDIKEGYFNLEVNCGGTPLFRFQKVAKVDQKSLDAKDAQQVEIAHSLPKIVDPEIAVPTTWTIEYRIPFAILEKWCKVTRPKAGVVWRANFYKIADDTSHPHWLTWSVVGKPKPDFHVPEFFGILEFK